MVVNKSFTMDVASGSYATKANDTKGVLAVLRLNVVEHGELELKVEVLGKHGEHGMALICTKHCTGLSVPLGTRAITLGTFAEPLHKKARLRPGSGADRVSRHGSLVP